MNFPIYITFTTMRCRNSVETHNNCCTQCKLRFEESAADLYTKRSLPFTHIFYLIVTILVYSGFFVTHITRSNTALIYAIFYSFVCFMFPSENSRPFSTSFCREPHIISHVTTTVTKAIITILVIHQLNAQNLVS